MWNLVQCNKLIGTQIKVQMHKNHLQNLSKTKSTIKGLSPWKPKHSISKLNNKYAEMKRTSINKENKSLINRMMDIQLKPPLNTTNIIPQHFPSNTKTHAFIKQNERYHEKLNINKQNYNILKRIESVQSLYGKQKWKQEWKIMRNYRNNIIKKQGIADYSQLAKSRISRPRTAMNMSNSEMA